ncbi:MAG TPA: GatB/YqeY domain-containing protein [Actinomycetota bacterium]|nr:GatB/YqeY domain-containing protein [Actinomycetota bacterium]
MGTLKERLTQEMREALKAGEKVRLGALRMLAASVKNREVELGHDLSDDELVEVATREVKRRKEAAEAFEAGKRPELAAKEREEQGFLETYMPEQLGEEEVRALVDEALGATGASGPGDLGKVMGYVMGRAKGKVDGTLVNALARDRLSG